MITHSLPQTVQLIQYTQFIRIQYHHITVPCLRPDPTAVRIATHAAERTLVFDIAEVFRDIHSHFHIHFSEPEFLYKYV